MSAQAIIAAFNELKDRLQGVMKFDAATATYSIPAQEFVDSMNVIQDAALARPAVVSEGQAVSDDTRYRLMEAILHMPHIAKSYRSEGEDGAYRDGFKAARFAAAYLVAAPAPEAHQPKLVLALPDYEKRRIVIVSDEVIDGERLVCVAIVEEIPEAPHDRQAMSHAEMLAVVDPWPCAVSSDQIQQIVDRDTPPDNRNEVVDHDLTGKPIARGDVERFSKAAPVAEAPTVPTLPKEWQGPWELQIDSCMTNREGVHAHVIGEELRIEYTDGSERWKIALPVPTRRDKKLGFAAPATEQAKSSRVTPKMRQAMDDAMEEVAGIAREIDSLRAEVEASPAQTEPDDATLIAKFEAHINADHFPSTEPGAISYWITQAEMLNFARGLAAQASPAKPDLAGLTLTEDQIDLVVKQFSTTLRGWEWSGEIIEVNGWREYEFARALFAAITSPAPHAALTAEDIGKIAVRLVNEKDEGADEEFVKGRLCGIGQLHAELLQWIERAVITKEQTK